jgi:hypothetical protein
MRQFGGEKSRTRKTMIGCPNAHLILGIFDGEWFPYWLAEGRRAVRRLDEAPPVYAGGGLAGKQVTPVGMSEVERH